jgi:hypothetical protein
MTANCCRDGTRSLSRFFYNAQEKISEIRLMFA